MTAVIVDIVVHFLFKSADLKMEQRTPKWLDSSSPVFIGRDSTASNEFCRAAEIAKEDSL